MTKSQLTILIFAAVITIFSSFAQAYTCVGPITYVGMSKGGVVAFSLPPLFVQEICSLNGNFNGVTPESCKGIFALLTAARLTGNKVRFQLRDDDGVGSCSGHKSWQPMTGYTWGPEMDTSY
jgi:hypothetical protein